jgi:lysozyme
MKISEKGLGLIKYYEQLRLKAYMPTPHDVPTIGYGHTKGVKMGDSCTKEQAERWLDEDCDFAEVAVNGVGVELTQDQFDALVSLVFNIGSGNFASSTIRKLLRAGDMARAADQFPRWNKQKGKVLNGLTARRAKERALFKSEP